MKKLYTAITLVLVITFLFSVKVSAQVPMSYRPAYNQMMMNMTMHMNMNMMMNQRWYYGFGYMVNKKYNYKVTMKDGSVLEVKSKIYADTVKHKSYLIYNNKNLKRDDPNREQKVYVDQTQKISREEARANDSFDVNGIATDSCWLFNVVKGKINIYSHLSEVELLDNSCVRAFQTGTGPIQKVDSVSLVAIIKDDPKAMKAFRKKDYFKAIEKYNSDNK